MNKKIYNEDLTLNLILNGDKVQQGNKKLLAELYALDQATRKLQLRNAALELEKRKLDKTDSGYAAKLRMLNTQIAMNNAAIDANYQKMMGLRKEIGLAGLTVNQLNNHLKILKIQLANATDPKIMRQLRREIQEVQVRLTSMTTGAGRLSQAWTRLAKDANRYSAAIGWISMVFYGIGTTIRRVVERLGTLDRKLSGVMKTTGLTRAEAARLKREFDTMGTPTKTDDLLDMARIAGKLGLEGYENIKRFTGAVDVLYTALGDDLNLSVEETAEKVGKLVNAFRVTDKLPIDEAILRTGSLLNQLDKSSVASAGTILEYMTRLSSLGTTANYPMEKLAGLAATLETVNIPAERGSTALRNIINGLGKYADKFSRILGMSLEDYKRAVEEDVNSIFLKLIELTSKGDKSIVDMVGSMGDFEVSGVRVQEVYGALAKNIDVVVKQQEIAERSFQSSASVMSEYNIITKDFQGSVDLQTKRLKKLADEMNLSVRPGVFNLYKLLIDFLYALRDAGRWLGNHSNLIKGIVALYIAWKGTAIATWIMAVKSAVVEYTKALFTAIKAQMANNALLIAWQRHGIKGVIVMLKQLWAVIIASPVGIIGATITVLGALAGAFFILKGRMDEVHRATADLQRDMIKQRSEMQQLFDAAEQTAIGTDKHRAAIKALNEVYGNYLPKLLTEKDGIDAVTESRNAAIKALEREIALKWKNDEFSKIEERMLEKRRKAGANLLSVFSGEDLGAASRDLDLLTEAILNDDYTNEYMKRAPKNAQTGKYTNITAVISTFMDAYGIKNRPMAANKYAGSLEQEKNAKTNLGLFTKGYLGSPSTGSGTTGTGGPSTGTGTEGPMTEEQFKQNISAIEKGYKERQVVMNGSRKDEDAFRKDNLQAEIDYTNQLIAVHEKYAAEDSSTLDDLKVKKSELQRQMFDDMNKSQKEQTQAEAEEDKKRIEAAVEAESDKYDRLMAQKKLAFTKGEMDEQSYNQDILDLELKKWQAIRAIQEKNGVDSSETQQKEADAELAIRQNTIKEMEAAAEQWLADEKLRIENEYGDELSQKDKYDQELLLAEITYQEALLQIRKQAGENTADIELKLHQLRKEMMQQNIGDAEEVEKELTRIYGKKNGYLAKYIALEKEIKTVTEDSTMAEDKKRVKIEVLNNAQKELTEVEAVRVATQISGDIAMAESAQEATVAILNGISERIRAYMAEAIAKAIVKEAGKGIVGIITATVAAAAFSMLFETLIPKFSVNSSTGRIEAKTMSWGPKTTQQAAGKYPVVGADDGRSYLAEWRGMAKTGIYTQPALIAEQGPEMVIDYPTLRNIQMNSPRLIDAVLAYRVPQRAGGKAPLTPQRGEYQDTSIKYQDNSAEMRALMANMNGVLVKLNKQLEAPITAKVGKYGSGSIDEAMRDIEKFNGKVNRQ